MRSVKYFISLMALAVSLSGYGQELKDYLKEAAENNPGLKAKYAGFEAAMEKTAQVNTLPDPNLTFGYFISPVETRVGPQQAKIGLSQMFPWFGTLAARGEVTTLLAEAKYQEFLDARNLLFYQVKEAWYPIYETQRDIMLNSENLEILNTFRTLALRRFETGKGDLVDIVRVDIMIDALTTEIDLMNTRMLPLLTRFNRLLNREDTMKVAVVDSLFIPPLDHRYRRDSLLIGNPVLESYALQFRSAESREILARKEGLPKLGVGIDYVMTGMREDVVMEDNGKDVLMPMVSISLPVFRSKYRAAENEARYLQTSIQASSEYYRNKLIADYEDAWYKLDKARQEVDLYHRQTEQINRAIVLLLVSYSNSGDEFEEILRMQQELLKYQLAETNAVTHYYTAMARIDYLTSKSE